MKLLILTPLYPPHHAGTFDFRAQRLAEGLEERGHEVWVLTSDHGSQAGQRDGRVERRLKLNGVFGHPRVQEFGELKELEIHNHSMFQRFLEEARPETIMVVGLKGLSKSLIATLSRLETPVAYGIWDDWLIEDLPTDPWLSFWNRDGLPFREKTLRASLEMSGQRKGLDAEAPTRFIPGARRFPELFRDPGRNDREVEPDSMDQIPLLPAWFMDDYQRQVAVARGFHLSGAAVIVPPIEVDRYPSDYKPEEADPRKLLITGALNPGSGILEAVEGIQELLLSRPGLSLTVYGTGESDYHARLKSLIVAAKLPVTVDHASDPTRDLPQVFAAHDVFLHTTLVGGADHQWPLEAMAAGLPAVVSATGSLRELLRHGETVIKFSPGNGPELVAALSALLDQPALRVKMARAGQAEIRQRCHAPVVLEQIEGVLRTAADWR